MAGLLMTRFGLLMGATTAGDGGGGTGVGVQLDAAQVGPGHTLSNDDRTLINTSGGSDHRRWVAAEKKLPGDHPVPFYWEFEANPAGPGQFNGYCAVVSQAQLDDPGDTYDSGENPVYRGSLGYRGSGDVWGNTGSNLGSCTAYGAGDIVMIAFDPASGGLWVGLNGTWENDPETAGPVERSTAAGGDFWPVAQAREPGEGGTLRSLPGQFSYPVPSTCIALGESLTPESGVAVSGLETWTELGGGADLGAVRVEVWHELGGGADLGAARVEVWYELGGGDATSAAAHELWIEKDTT